MKKTLLTLSIAAVFAVGASAAEFKAGTYTAKAPGIHGDVTVTVTFTKDKITDVKVTHSETPGIGSKAAELLPGRIVERQSPQVDGVTGATITSTAIRTAVADTVKQAGADPAALVPLAVKKQAKNETVDTDVVVVGGGGAGMSATIRTRMNGLNVVLVEKMPFIGGAASISGGQVVAQGSKLQKAFGVTDDSVESMVKDFQANGHNLNDLSKLTLYARKGVILATGGYARNKEMVARYPVAHYFSNVPHGNVGDGLTAAEKIGALNYEHPAVQVVYTSLTCGIGINDESGLIVNDRGERVVNEWSYQYTVSDAIARSGSNCGWYITSGKEPYGGVQYGYKSAVAGKSKDPCATSIEGLAKKMGCDPATLQATYDRYCELVEKGVDEDFGKPAEFLHPIKGPKFVALRMHPCVTVTFGGLETDVSARVMKPDGSVIPHLYAAGEVAGTGMYGTQYPTCGTSIGSALFYGRIAGRAVTDQALL